MKIRKYNDFWIQYLLESVLVTTKDFKQIIHDMPSDNQIANILYDIIDDKKDIKTNYNFVDQSDKNDEITFIPDNQFQRFKDKGEDVSSKTKNKSKIGRAIRQILNDNGHANITAQEIEKFVNQFKSTWDLKHGVGRKVELVTGDKIIYWYNEKNYYKSVGTLGNSCMRYPSKAQYMRIYADNPDKISLLVVLQDDKLVARALVWKLDDGKVYLDRIYTTTESDYEFVYKWALKNIGGGKAENMPSHLQDDAGELVCSLQNVNPEEFPYADSMMHVFQELKDGVLTGKGFMSNTDDGDEDLHQNYVVRTIQHTDGDSTVVSHKFSEYFGKWVPNDKATWSSDIDSWCDIDLTVLCRFDSNRYLKENCVFNEIVNDWIPKRRGVENEKYGFILPNMLVEIAVAYTGKETEPLAIWFDIDNNRDGVLKTITDLKKNGETPLFRPERSPYRGFWSSEFKVEDYGYDEQVDLLCYPLYKVVNKKETYLDDQIYFSYSGKYWVTDLDAVMFDISVDRSEKSYVSAFDYMRGYEDTVYVDIVDTIKNSDLSVDQKTKRLEIAKQIHEYMNDYDSDYKYRNQIYDKFKPTQQLEIAVDIVNRAYNDIEDNKEWRYGEELNLSEYIKIGIQDELNREDQSLYDIIYKYFRLFCFFYDLNRDVYDASTLLERFTQRNYPDDYEKLNQYMQGYGDNSFYMMRRIFRRGADDQIRTQTTDYKDEFASKNDLDIRPFRSKFFEILYKRYFYGKFTEEELNIIKKLLN